MFKINWKWFFSDALDAFDGGVRQTVGVNATAGIWATYPQSFLSTGNGFADQVMLASLSSLFE